MERENGTCECAQLIVAGKRTPPYHDCEYVRQRNALIPEAERIADSFVEVVPPGEDDGVSHAKWTREFSIAMDELAKPLLNGSNGIAEKRSA